MFSEPEAPSKASPATESKSVSCKVVAGVVSVESTDIESHEELQGRLCFACSGRQTSRRTRFRLK